MVTVSNAEENENMFPVFKPIPDPKHNVAAWTGLPVNSATFAYDATQYRMTPNVVVPLRRAPDTSVYRPNADTSAAVMKSRLLPFVRPGY